MPIYDLLNFFQIKADSYEDDELLTAIRKGRHYTFEDEVNMNLNKAVFILRYYGMILFQV